MTVDTLTPTVCPLCGRPVEDLILQFNRHLEPHVVRILRDQNPGWKQAEGACPDCVQQGMQEARRLRSETSLHTQLALPFPVYAPEEARLLAITQRIPANPQYTGRGVTMAFIDSGFYPHPDLARPADRILCHVDATGATPVEKPRFKKPHVTSWHGLMTACMAAGNGFLSGGLYCGLASQARLVLVKTGNRRGRGIRDRDIARALTWVIENQARYDIHVVNISVGGDFPSTGEPTPLDDLVEDAVAHGMVVVAAAGNGGLGRIVPPASAPSAITVGGLDDQNSLDPRFRRMWRSSFGRGVNAVRKPELIAPAMWLAAPLLPGTWQHNECQFLWQLERSSDAELSRFLERPFAEARFKKETLRKPLHQVRRIIRQRMAEQKYIHPNYQHVDGTSMSAPIVASVAAQMLEANPALTPAQVKALMLATAEPLRYVPQEEQGFGMVNAAQAVAAALRLPGGALAGVPLSPHITSRGITFYHNATGAREVAVVGAFNGWQPCPGQMQETRAGLWQLHVPAPGPGCYPYKFLIDRARWVNDAENAERVEDGFGGFHSVLVVEER